MAKLVKSIRKENGYGASGIMALIAFRTFLANGVTPSAAITRGTDGVVTGVVLDASVLPVVIESEEDKANFTAPLTVGASGKYVTQTLGFTLGGLSEAKSKSLEDVDLVKHSYVVKTRKGKYFLLGEKNGMTASQNNAGVGAGMGDLDGYDIIVSGAELGRPVEISEAAWTALTVLVPAD